MQKNQAPINYGDYLQLDKILHAQQPESVKYQDFAAHDETLFIIVHQVYELWFKQILHELAAIRQVFCSEKVQDDALMLVVHRLERIVVIQKLMNEQIGVMETMTPQDFLEFRDYLVPASGFQSIQFKLLEIGLGLKMKTRIAFDRESFLNRLSKEQRLQLEQAEEAESLFELIDVWLARMPFLNFGDFNFWQHFRQATEKMLESDEKIIRANDVLSEKELEFQLKELAATKQSFSTLWNAEKYENLKKKGDLSFSHKGMLAALFINLYRDEPVFQLPFKVLTCLAEIDENLTLWRYKHAMMVQRMLGSKIGTGGSSGHDYLKRTTEQNRVFKDLFSLSTFLLPKSALPELPNDVKAALGFFQGS